MSLACLCWFPTEAKRSVALWGDERRTVLAEVVGGSSAEEPNLL